MERISILIKLLSFFLLNFFLSTQASAAMITQFGNNVAFTYDDATILGQGNVVDDVLTFSPVSLSAEAIGPNQLGVNSFFLSLNISTLLPNRVFSFIGATEGGDYVLNGVTATANLDAFLEVDFNSDGLNDDGVALLPDSPLTNNDGEFHNWQAQAVLDVNAVQASNVDLLLSNTLLVQTYENDELAFISQKLDNIGVAVVVAEVPLPASVLFFISALFSLFIAQSKYSSFSK